MTPLPMPRQGSKVNSPVLTISIMITLSVLVFSPAGRGARAGDEDRQTAEVRTRYVQAIETLRPLIWDLGGKEFPKEEPVEVFQSEDRISVSAGDSVWPDVDLQPSGNRIQKVMHLRRGAIPDWCNANDRERGRIKEDPTKRTGPPPPKIFNEVYSWIQQYVGEEGMKTLRFGGAKPHTLEKTWTVRWFQTLRGFLAGGSITFQMHEDLGLVFFDDWRFPEEALKLKSEPVIKIMPDQAIERARMVFQRVSDRGEDPAFAGGFRREFLSRPVTCPRPPQFVARHSGKTDVERASGLIPTDPGEGNLRLAWGIVFNSEEVSAACGGSKRGVVIYIDTETGDVVSAYN